MKNRSLYVVVSVTVVATLLLVLLGAFAGGLIFSPYFLNEVQAAQSPNVPAAADQGDLVAALEQSLIDIYQGGVPSVVNISVTKKVDANGLQGFDFNQHPFIPSPNNPDQPQQDTPHDFFFDQGQGSGFVCRYRTTLMYSRYWSPRDLISAFSSNGMNRTKLSATIAANSSCPACG